MDSDSRRCERCGGGEGVLYLPQGCTCSKPRTKASEALANRRELRRSIISLAWPVLIEQALQTVTQMADMMMVSWIGSSATAAVGLSNHPLFIMQGIFMGLGTGTTAIVARFIGAGRKDKAEKTMAQSVAIATLVGFIVSLVGYLLTPSIVQFMGAEADVIPLGESYMRALMPGMFALALNMTVSAALRGAGDAKFPMAVNAVINAINIVLNYLWIYGKGGFPVMGVTGAALATTVARIVGTAWMIMGVTRPDNAVLRLSIRKDFKFDWKLLGRVAHVGLPNSIERSSLSLGIILFVRVVASLGTTAYAAHAIAINAEQVSQMAGFAFAVAATALVSRGLGAEDTEFAANAGWEAWKMSAVVMGVGALVLFFFPHLLMRMYTADPEIITMGSQVLRIIAIVQLPMSSAFTLVGALRGAGDTRAVLAFILTAVWLVRLPLVHLFVRVFGWGLAGAWVAMAVDWCTRGTVGMVRFRKGKWKSMRI